MVMKIKREQYEEVFNKKQAGATLSELAKEYGGEWGISMARISQIVKEVRELKEKQTNENPSN
jgi:Mor family transcriptional regulator